MSYEQKKKLYEQERIEYPTLNGQLKSMKVFVKEYLESLSLDNGIEYQISQIEFIVNYLTNKKTRLEYLKKTEIKK